MPLSVGDCLLLRAVRWVRRRLLPDFDLMLLQRRRLLRFVKPGAFVLDAGCGDGTLSLLLHGRGCRVVGVSNDGEAIARLRDHCAALGLPAETIDFRVHDLARDGPPLPSAEAKALFDAAVCFDVLEHIADDRSALAAIAASLRQGGQLLLTVPDRAAPPLLGDCVSEAADGGHVRAGYTRPELDALLRELELTPTRWAGFGGFLAQKATNVSRRLERHTGTPFAILRFLWLVAMRPLCSLDPLIPWPSYELFVLAEKMRNA
jgi:SAM-dependent methyltransferase